MGNQCKQHGIFGAGKIYCFTIPVNGLGIPVNIQIVVMDMGRNFGNCLFVLSFIYLVTSDQCLYPADQFRIGKRLRQIVVSAAREAQSFITVFGAGT